MIKTNLSNEKFRDRIIELIDKNNELNINTATDSFVYKIFDSLAQGNKENVDALNELIQRNDISKLSGKSLDNFFELFNLARLKYHKNVFLFEITYFGELEFQLKTKTMIQYNNENYVLIKDTDFDKELKTISLYTKKLEQNNLNPREVIKINDLQISTEFIEYNKNQIKKELETNASLTYFGEEEYDLETDESFLNRGTNLFQTMSSNSEYKILSEVKLLSGVYDAYFTKEELTSWLTIIPVNIEKINDLIDKAKEIINYFKNKRIEVSKPNYIQFRVKGLFKQQIKESDKQQIKNWIQNWIRTIYLRNLKFDRTKFEIELNSFLIETNSNYRINFNELEILYEIFLESDFELQFEKNKIYQNEIKTFTNGIFNCKEVM